MLINNLNEHREKYSHQCLTSPCKSIKSSSNSKFSNLHAKTQKQFKVKNKMGSQKKLRTDRNSYFFGRTHKNPDKKEELFNEIISNKIKYNDHHQTSSKLSPVATWQNFTGNQKQTNYQKPTQNGNNIQKIERRLERKSTIRKIPVPFCEQTGSEEDKLSTKQQTASKFQATTKPNTKTLISPAKTTKSSYRSILLEKERTIEDTQKQEQLIATLRINQVFFCRDCYRYIFAIQKGYHYPNCKQPFPKAGLSAYEKYKAGLERLLLLVELSQYSRYKPELIRKFYDDVEKHGKIPECDAEIISGRRCFSLLEIETTAHIVVNDLIRQYLWNRVSGFCSNARCDVDNQL